MSLSVIMRELWRFIKEKMKILLTAGLVGIVLLIGFRYTIHHFLYGDKQAEYNYLKTVYDQEPAYFQAVITNQDDDLFSNAGVIDEYFTTPEMFDKVEEKTGIEFRHFFECEQALELKKTSNYRGGLAGVRDGGSGVLTLRFLVGQSGEENLKIAQAYCNIMEEEGLPFINGSHIEILTRPTMTVLLDEEEITTIAQPKSLNVYASPGLVKNVIYGVLGFILGIGVAVVVLFIRQLNQGKITYAFDYSWGFNDEQMIYEGSLSELVELIAMPHNKNKAVLVQEESLNKKLLETNNYSNTTYTRDFSDLAPNGEVYDQMVIVIEEGITDKAWYKKQAKMAEFYQMPLMIFQVR